MESLSPDILGCIVSSLSQRDAIALSICSKKLANAYPRHISKVFSVDASYQEYDCFLRWLCNHPHIECLRVVVHPVRWNEACERLGRGGWGARRIAIFPTHIHHIDHPPWTPPCEELVSGFVESDFVVAYADAGTVFFRDPLSLIRSSACQLPDFAPETDVRRIVCLGRIGGIRRIPNTIEHVSMSHAVLEPPDIEHLASFGGEVTLLNCTATGCRPIAFSASALEIDVAMMRLISKAPLCTRMKIWMSGTEPVYVGSTFPSVAEIVIAGQNQTSNLAVIDMIHDIFPNVDKIIYDFTLVDPPQQQ